MKLNFEIMNDCYFIGSIYKIQYAVQPLFR
jgi:hypothetical protein